ncbi:hypothetical protein [Streptomyces sp. BE133]|uniref:hypothetical protein n=1 Tax=Streptomyces sp. BE133 TaxID=3002523 RepID=UPI003FA752B5
MALSRFRPGLLGDRAADKRKPCRRGTARPQPVSADVPLYVFTEAAELDRDRARGGWAQLHAVQAAFWGRRHGFRSTGNGSRLDWQPEFVDRLAELLTERAR